MASLDLPLIPPPIDFVWPLEPLTEEEMALPDLEGDLG
jgi:hypothetical protein